MNACMYVCIMYVCMSVLQSARHSALRSLIGALIGALCGVGESLVKYAHIENVCIYRRADYTGSTIYADWSTKTHTYIIHTYMHAFIHI